MMAIEDFIAWYQGLPMAAQIGLPVAGAAGVVLIATHKGALHGTQSFGPSVSGGGGGGTGGGGGGTGGGPLAVPPGLPVPGQPPPTPPPSIVSPAPAPPGTPPPTRGGPPAGSPKPKPTPAAHHPAIAPALSMYAIKQRQHVTQADVAGALRPLSKEAQQRKIVAAGFAYHYVPRPVVPAAQFIGRAAKSKAHAAQTDVAGATRAPSAAERQRRVVAGGFRPAHMRRPTPAPRPVVRNRTVAE